MGLLELFAAILILGISCINSTLPAVAGLRSGDRRFGIVSLGNALLGLLGAFWTWGQLPVASPAWTVAPLPVLVLVLLVTVLFLASTLWPRST